MVRLGALALMDSSGSIPLYTTLSGGVLHEELTMCWFGYFGGNGLVVFGIKNVSGYARGLDTWWRVYLFHAGDKFPKKVIAVLLTQYILIGNSTPREPPLLQPS